MIKFKLNQAKSMFFTKDLLRSMGRSEYKALSKMGAFIRRSAKSSIRKRKKSSLPGRPPSSHTGLLKKHIYFGFDRVSRNVVVGPVRLNGTADSKSLKTLEFGGTAEIQNKNGVIFADIAPRPYMGPALVVNQKIFPTLYANTVKP